MSNLNKLLTKISVTLKKFNGEKEAIKFAYSQLSSIEHDKYKLLECRNK